VAGMMFARYNTVRLMEQAITRRPPPSLRPEHPGRRSLLQLFLCAQNGRPARSAKPGCSPQAVRLIICPRVRP
jgi:hypothetical protein